MEGVGQGGCVEKKKTLKPEKNPKQPTTHQYLSCEESSSFPKSTFFFPLWFGGAKENLSRVYKPNQDKADCFLLSSAQLQIQAIRSPSLLLSRPEAD